ncbi:MAG: hypothetical protein SVR94_08590 [Pseudomonadota bacterium]|nr:hypothetical protein [Pseudomonadota bacterium]
MRLWQLFQFVSLLCWLPRVAAQPFYWQWLDVDIVVKENSDLLVTETQNSVFAAPYTFEHYQWIPLEMGEKITDITVFEGDKKLPLTTGISNHHLWISWRHSPHSHRFVLKYRIIGGLKQNIQAHQLPPIAQIHWKALFPYYSSQIEYSRVVVHLPVRLADKLQGYEIKNHSSVDSLGFEAYQKDRQTLEFIAQRTLLAGESLEITINFLSDSLTGNNSFLRTVWSFFSDFGQSLLNIFPVLLVIGIFLFINNIRRSGEHCSHNGLM